MTTGQSRRGSAAEAAINVAVGLVVAMIANHFVFPLFGFVPSLAASAQITAIYTAISLVRSYCLRRAFNWFGFRRPPRKSA
jgi:hypothetical protein